MFIAFLAENGFCLHKGTAAFAKINYSCQGDTRSGSEIEGGREERGRGSEEGARREKSRSKGPQWTR